MTLITGTKFGGVVLGTVITGASFWFLMQSAPLRNEDACAGCTERYGPLVMRFSYELPADQTFQSSSRTLVAFSPDGTRFIYNTIEGLYLRTLPQTVVKSRLSVERRINRSELYLADELFLTGTAAHVTPVGYLDNRPVGDGGIGPTTRSLADLYANVVKGNNPKYLHWCTAIALEG